MKLLRILDIRHGKSHYSETNLEKTTFLMISAKYLSIYRKNRSIGEYSKKNMTVFYGKVWTSLVLDETIEYLHNQSHKKVWNLMLFIEIIACLENHIAKNCSFKKISLQIQTNFSHLKKKKKAWILSIFGKTVSYLSSQLQKIAFFKMSTARTLVTNKKAGVLSIFNYIISFQPTANQNNVFEKISLKKKLILSTYLCNQLSKSFYFHHVHSI